MTWDEVLENVEAWLEATFILNSHPEKVVWMAVIGFAARLEYLAAAVLWVNAGQRGVFEEYQERMTLGKALRELELEQVLSESTLTGLQHIWKLRNAVVHSSATYGLSIPQRSISSRGLPDFDGRNIFKDPDAFAAFRSDVDDAIGEMVAWLRANLKGGTFQ